MVLQTKNLLQGEAEYARKGERQQKAGNIAVALDRINALPRNPYRRRKLLLRPAACEPQLLYAIGDRVLHVKYTLHNNSGSCQAYFPFTYVHVGSLTSLLSCVKIRLSSARSLAAYHPPVPIAHKDERLTAASFSFAFMGAELKPAVLGLAMILAAVAGYTDWRRRRIPNWLTVSGAIAGLAVNGIVGGWGGLKASLLGLGLGLLLLLPFVLLRSLGAGDWKLAGALGAVVGPSVLIDLLIGSIFVAGIMAFALVIYKRRLMQTLRNIGRMLGSMLQLHMPGPEVSLDNPESLKIPYGVALAFTTLCYGAFNWRMLSGR